MASHLSVSAPTIPRLWAARAARTPEGRAITVLGDKGAEPALTWQGWSHRVSRLGAGLYRAGLRPGDRVFLYGRTWEPLYTINAAAQSIGAVTVPAYDEQAPARLQPSLTDSGAKFLYVQGRPNLEAVCEALGPLANLRGIVTAERFNGGPPNHFTFAELMEEGTGREGLFHELADKVLPEQTAQIFFTSGTTGRGRSKPVPHSHETLMTALDSILAVFGDQFGPRNTLYNLVKLPHIYGTFENLVQLAYGMFMTSSGADYALRGRAIPNVRPNLLFAAPEILKLIRGRIESQKEILVKELRHARENAGILKSWVLGKKIALIERAFAALDAAEDERGRVEQWIHQKLVFRKIRDKMGGIETLISAGSRLGIPLWRFLARMGFRIINVWGASEGVPFALTDGSPEMIGTVGRLAPGVKAKRGEDGILRVTGPQLMRGYGWDAEKPSLDFHSPFEAGWYVTGDQGYVREDGCVVLVGRDKSKFKNNKGEWIIAESLEEIYSGARPLLKRLVVFGENQKFPAALVVVNLDVLRPHLKDLKVLESPGWEGDPTVRDLVAAAIQEAFHKGRQTKELEDHEQIRNFAILPEDLSGEEMTETKKLIRDVIFERRAAVMASLLTTEETSAQQA